jgi:hypothetical protein
MRKIEWSHVAWGLAALAAGAATYWLLFRQKPCGCGESMVADIAKASADLATKKNAEQQAIAADVTPVSSATGTEG